jgi:hypothetical protein
MEASATAGTPTPSTDDMLREILAEQQAHRAEVAELRAQIDAQKTPPPPPSASVQSADDLAAARLAEINQHDYYCPGCGKLVDYRQQCLGLSGDKPHPPIEVVSTDELKSGDTSQHTPAPAVVT